MFRSLSAGGGSGCLDFSCARVLDGSIPCTALWSDVCPSHGTGGGLRVRAVCPSECIASQPKARNPVTDRPDLAASCFFELPSRAPPTESDLTPWLACHKALLAAAASLRASLPVTQPIRGALTPLADADANRQLHGGGDADPGPSDTSADSTSASDAVPGRDVVQHIRPRAQHSGALAGTTWMSPPAGAARHSRRLLAACEVSSGCHVCVHAHVTKHAHTRAALQCRYG